MEVQVLSFAPRQPDGATHRVCWSSGGGGEGEDGSRGEAAPPGAAGLPPECHPNGGGKLAERLRVAAAEWEADGDAAALRRALLGLLLELERP